jgi:hypothetical protein
VCWLLLAVIAGSAIGFQLGLPGSSPGGDVSAHAGAKGGSGGLTFAPATGRRPVVPVGLYTGRTSSPGLQRLSGVDGESLALSSSGGDAARGDGSGASFAAPYARELTFLAFPSGAEPPAPTTTTPAATTPATTTTTPAAPTGPPPSIDNVHTISLTPFSATLAWQTSEAATSRVVYGLDAPVIWTAPTESGTTHVVTVGGLTHSSTYHLDVTATTADGRSAVAQFLLTTPDLNGPVEAATANGAILLNGQPAFPKMVFDQCPDGVSGNLAVGIDTFMGNACGSGAQLASWLNGTAFVIANAAEAPSDRVGAIGTHLPDEWDTHLPNTFSTADAFRLFPVNAGSGPRFLTLTNHFYSHAAPLPQGRGMYTALATSADVLGFDLYPLQNWCRFDSFGDVFDSQLDLVALARGKPTYQWIEARRMDCQGDDLDPTPATVRAEAWLSIAGGAHAIGYFPNNWSPAVGAEIARTNHDISTLAPALVEPGIAASVSLGSTVKVGARDHNGAVYLIAVNASREPATATITVPGLGDRSLVTIDGQDKAQANGGSFTTTFAPLEARIYVAAPAA